MPFHSFYIFSHPVMVSLFFSHHNGVFPPSTLLIVIFGLFFGFTHCPWVWPPTRIAAYIRTTLLSDHIVVIYPPHVTAEDESWRSLPKGVYGDNMIAQQSISDVSSDTNEWSHSWAMSKPQKTQNINNQQCWRWNDAIVMGEKKLIVKGWLEVTMRI